MTNELLATALLGGILGVIGNSLIEMMRGDNELLREQYKVQLLKSEFFFHEQYNAACAFCDFYQTIMPPKRPTMKWEDAMCIVANDLRRHNDFIKKFILKYDVLFEQEIILSLNMCRNIAFSFMEAEDDCVMNGTDMVVWYEGTWEYGDEFYAAVEKSYEEIKKAVMNQIKL
jgi:hypothetical protein